MNSAAAGTVTPVLAPIAGYTDLPFRRMCRRFGAHFAHTALIDAGALVHGNPDNPLILRRGAEEPWLAVQLLGSIPADVRRAAEMLRDMPFDAVDFNMGCPVRKIIRRCAGAALMRHPELAFSCLEIIRAVIADKPVTVKTRILDENDPEPTVVFCRELEKRGIDGLTLHGRLPSRMYAGPVATAVIRAVRASLRIPVTANGGVFAWGDAAELSGQTGCRRIMVARGAIGNPWIFRELLAGADLPPPPHEEVCQVMRDHLLEMVELYGETGAMINGRKIIHAYLVGRGYRRSLRAAAVSIRTLEQFDAFYRQVLAEGPVGNPEHGARDGEENHPGT